MTIDNILDPSESCGPPVCLDTISVRILSFECTGAEVIISWTIDNALLNPSQNRLLWSVDNQNFNNIQLSQNSSSPFLSIFSIPAPSGILFFKAKVLVGSTFYESAVINLNLNDCNDASEYIVPASTCTIASDNYVDLTGSVFSNIWVKENGVPQIPVGVNGIKRIHFKYNGECLFLDDDNFNSKILVGDATGQIILNSITLEYPDCSSCFDPPSFPCSLESDTVFGVNNFDKTYTVKGTDCFDFVYGINGPDINKIIIINNETGEILFETACTFVSALTTQRVSINGIDSIKVIVDVECSSVFVGTSSWEYTISCCN